MPNPSSTRTSSPPGRLPASGGDAPLAQTAALVLLTSAAVLLLGAGCRKAQPTVSPSTAAPTPVPAAPAASAPTSALLVAPAPLGPPPPDTPEVPSAPPGAADAVAPSAPPTPAPPASPPAPVPPAPSSAPAPAAAPEPAPVAVPPRVIRITAKQWVFEPAEVRVRRGEPVVLEVTSTDVDHGLALPDFNINRTLKPGATERIELTPDSAGSFSMVCSVFCGRGHSGMRGTLIVE